MCRGARLSRKSSFSASSLADLPSRLNLRRGRSGDGSPRRKFQVRVTGVSGSPGNQQMTALLVLRVGARYYGTVPELRPMRKIPSSNCPSWSSESKSCKSCGMLLLLQAGQHKVKQINLSAPGDHLCSHRYPLAAAAADSLALVRPPAAAE